MSDPSNNAVDRLVHIADIHFWRVTLNPFRLVGKRALGALNVLLRRRRDFAMERAEQFADAVAATGINAVLLTGDFTSTSLDEEFALARASSFGAWLGAGCVPTYCPATMMSTRSRLPGAAALDATSRSSCRKAGTPREPSCRAVHR